MNGTQKRNLSSSTIDSGQIAMPVTISWVSLYTAEFDTTHPRADVIRRRVAEHIVKRFALLDIFTVF